MKHEVCFVVFLKNGIRIQQEKKIALAVCWWVMWFFLILLFLLGIYIIVGSFHPADLCNNKENKIK